MLQRDAIDFAAAFAVGAVLGVGAALLLRPEPPTRAERILKDLEPYREKLRKSAHRARKGFREGAGATAEMGEALRGASRELLHDFREEIAEMIAAARNELALPVKDQVSQARRARGRAGRRPGRS